MKILHVLTDTNIGGAGRYLLALLKSHNRANSSVGFTDSSACFSIEVVLPTGSRLTPFIEALDVPVIEIPFIQERSFSIKGVAALYKLFGERKPDLIHTHASFSGRIAAKLRGLPVIYSRHYCVPEPTLKHKIFGFANNFFNDGIIATSPEVTAGMAATGTSLKRITTIYNGVPPLKRLSQEEKAVIRKRYDISNSAFVISQIARLDPVKGHDLTLDAAKLLAQYTDIVILLAGDGPLEMHLHKRIEAESIKNVIMTGFIPEIEEIFNITDLQVCASYTETSSLVLLEGMSLGIPAVATDAGGNPFVILHKERGLLVPCGNGAALAEAILTIKNDPALYKQLSKGAELGYNNQFRAENMTRQVEDLYQAVLKKG